MRELRTMVEFALWTPLQDERVAGAPLEAVAKLLEEPELDSDSKTTEEIAVRDRRNWAEAVLSVVAPLLEKAAPPPALARALARLAQQHPRSQLVPALGPAITRCLKHTVDFGKSPDMRKLLQVGISDNVAYTLATCGMYSLLICASPSFDYDAPREIHSVGQLEPCLRPNVGFG